MSLHLPGSTKVKHNLVTWWCSSNKCLLLQGPLEKSCVFFFFFFTHQTFMWHQISQSILFQLSYLLLQEGFSGPFQFFFQLIQLDVPAATKRSALGGKLPYLVGMNIHLFWIIIFSTVLLLIDKRIYVQCNAACFLEIILQGLHRERPHLDCHLYKHMNKKNI